MSRLIVKNLPNKVTVEQLREVFGQKGEVTDVQLKYTNDGKFRNFGFIGFRTEEQAAAAREYFDGTCIRSMKIDVQVCANLGDDKKPRAWSKYAPDSTAYKILHQDEIEEKKKFENKQKKKLDRRKDKIKELLKKHKDDPLFAEFIEAHSNSKNAWIKDMLEEAAKSDEDDDSNEESEEKKLEKEGEVEEQVDNEDKPEKLATKKITDLEYMKSLIKKVENNDANETTKEEEKPKKVRNRPLFHVKITGLPFKCKKKDIKEFFRPLVPYSIRLPLGKGKKISGFCYVGFRTEKELKKAISKDKLFIGNHRLHIHKYEDKAKKEAEEKEQELQKKINQKGDFEESIGESGSIFVRNLPYVVSENELTSLFEKYGPLAEVNMPIDKVLRQPKGFATVTFVMPEHAVKAFSELDGTAFCGRMLHLLPAKTDKVDDQSDDEDLSFKEKKAKKLKAQAKSSHNWNALFLGPNAIADVVASTYNTTKEQLLIENNKNTSAAVRLALGETQLVSETRAFLENNGVYLDAFNKPAKRRSRTCIIVKNLPANTDEKEIRTLFEKFGEIARFLLPKHGISALVDFVEPFEAKKAFTKLAYSQFKSQPLYLEWAPENVFSKSVEQVVKAIKTNESEGSEEKESNLYVREGVEDTIKSETSKKIEELNEIEEPENNTTLFVKNLNFKTNEEYLKKGDPGVTCADDARSILFGAVKKPESLPPTTDALRLHIKRCHYQHFSTCGKVHTVTIAKKKDTKHPGQFLSMGYGFVQYLRACDANEALKLLQASNLDGKTLEIKRSERANTNEVKATKKYSKDIEQNGTKILVRNVPFQANRNELHEIFRAFGEIKTLRLPKKLSPGSEQHRGFAFVDFLSKTDAKNAFEALCQSTHLYGRRLVLEWADQTDDNEDIATLRKRTAKSFNAKTPGGKKSRKGAIDVETFVHGSNAKDES